MEKWERFHQTMKVIIPRGQEEAREKKNQKNTLQGGGRKCYHQRRGNWNRLRRDARRPKGGTIHPSGKTRPEEKISGNQREIAVGGGRLNAFGGKKEEIRGGERKKKHRGGRYYWEEDLGGGSPPSVGNFCTRKN